MKLIEKEELDITEVSLAKIADEYIEHIKRSPEIGAEEMADFLFLATRLLYIKSKAIFPYFNFGSEDEDLGDLEEQLKMYKKFLEATKTIEAMIGKKKFMFSREFNRNAMSAMMKKFVPPKDLKKEDLREIFNYLIERLKPAEKLEEKNMEATVNIEDRITYIQNELKKQAKFYFSKMLNNAGSKVEVIVSFLAMLELAKQRILTIEQDSLFEDIILVKK